MTHPQPPVSPTQADRDAAASTMDGEWADPRGAKKIREGEWDHHQTVQAFARHRLSAIAPGGVDRNAILCAARAWWAAHMPNSTVRAINIQGDGRVKIAWRDHEESGHYTLPVDFLSLPQAPAGGEAKLREASIRAALAMSDLIGDGVEDLIQQYEAICSALGISFTEVEDEPDDALRAALSTVSARDGEG